MLSNMVQDESRLYAAITFERRFHIVNRVFARMMDQKADELEGQPSQPVVRPGEVIRTTEPAIYDACERTKEDPLLGPQPFEIWLKVAHGYWAKEKGTVRTEHLQVEGLGLERMWIFEGVLTAFELRVESIMPRLEEARITHEDTHAKSVVSYERSTQVFDGAGVQLQMTDLPDDEKLKEFRGILAEVFVMVDEEISRDLARTRDKDRPGCPLLGDASLARVVFESGLASGTVQARCRQISTIDHKRGETPARVLTRLFEEFQESEFESAKLPIDQT